MCSLRKQSLEIRYLPAFGQCTPGLKSIFAINVWLVRHKIPMLPFYLAYMAGIVSGESISLVCMAIETKHTVETNLIIMIKWHCINHSFHFKSYLKNYVSRLMVVSREAKKQQARALQDHAATVIYTRSSSKFLNIAKAPRKLLYRLSTFLLGRITTVRTKWIGTTSPENQHSRILWQLFVH